MKVTFKQDIQNPELACIAVVLVYEDIGCALRAKAALDGVISPFTRDEASRMDVWRFDLLEDGLLEREAADQADRADVVAVAMHGNRPLPPGVGSWLRLWLNRNDPGPRVLAVFMDENQRDAPAAFETVLYFCSACQRSGVDLLLTFEQSSSATERAISTCRSEGPAGGFPLPVEALRLLQGLCLECGGI